MSGPWPAGSALLAATKIALDLINSRTDILPGYRLVIHWGDTQVGAL